MKTRRAGLAIAMCGALLAAGCTGGKESSAAEEQLPKKNPIAQSQQQPASEQVNAAAELKDISTAIPIYAGAQFRDDLTRRDAVMIRDQFGPQARVYTLATNDSYPQVYHYYTTYLSQFRAFPLRNPYPPEQQNWRTLEVRLNEAMQDPFIPGDTFAPQGQQVTLQVAETEAEPKTVIRYIVTPSAGGTAQVAERSSPVVTGLQNAPTAPQQGTQPAPAAVR